MGVTSSHRGLFALSAATTVATATLAARFNRLLGTLRLRPVAWGLDRRGSTDLHQEVVGDDKSNYGRVSTRRNGGGVLGQEPANGGDQTDNIPAVVWRTVCGPGGHRVVSVNRFAEAFLGYPAQNWTDAEDFWLKIVHPDDRDSFQAWVDQSCRAGPRPVPTECRWVARDGSEYWVETRLNRFRDSDGTTGFTALTLDVTDRHRLENNLRSRATDAAVLAAALERSNEELEKFAYVTSHDLKAPLRGIFNLSQWIEEDLGDRITAAARDQMGLLRGRVHRMEALIDGLLAYAHVGRTDAKIETVDVSKLLVEIVDWVDPPPGIRVGADTPLPTFRGDKIRLQQVLTNLIDNAVKHYGKVQGQIVVSCHRVDEFFNFAVTDGGIGIEPRYHDRIFTIFQTLLPRDQREGSGIGLAMVKKIVVTKGGHVAVDSAPGEGARFEFTWPVIDPADVRKECQP